MEEAGEGSSMAPAAAAAAAAATPAAAALHTCRHSELHNREIGGLRPSLFAHRIGACEDVIERLVEYKRLSGHRGSVNTVHFNHAGDRLVSGSEDKQIIFWDWMAGRKKLSYPSGHEHNVYQAKVMPFSDDRSVITSASDGQVRHGLITEDGRAKTKSIGKHHGPAHKLAIEPGSPRTFFSCGEDGVVQHFDLRDNRSTKLLTCQSSDGRTKVVVRLNSIVFNPRNPNYFAVGGTDEYARVYDVRRIDPGEDNPVSLYSPKHLIGYPRVHITCVAYSQQEELLVSYNDELIYLFQKDMVAQSGAADPRGHLHLCDEDAEAEDEDEEEAEEAEEAEDAEEAEEAEDAEEAEEDEAEAEEEVHDHEAEEDDRGPEVYKGHRNAQSVKGVSFMGPSSEYVVSGSDCGHVFIWRKRGGKLVRMFKGDKRVVNCLEPHPHATFLATSGMDKTVKVWAPTSWIRDPFPVNAEMVMERNRKGREDLSSMPFTPEIIMRVLHLQSRFNHSHRNHHQHHNHGQQRQQQQSQQEDDELTNMNLGGNSDEDDESSDDSLDSPRECIIS